MTTDDRLDRIDTKLDTLTEAVNLLTGEHTVCRAQVHSMEDALFRVPKNGDGGGLAFLVNRNTQDIKQAKALGGWALSAAGGALVWLAGYLGFGK